MAGESQIQFKGSGKPMSGKRLSRLKKEVQASKQQSKIDSRVDAKTLRTEFNC